MVDISVGLQVRVPDCSSLTMTARVEAYWQRDVALWDCEDVSYSLCLILHCGTVRTCLTACVLYCTVGL